MSEFGHVYSNSNSIFVDTWGAGPFVLMVAGRFYRFEDSDRFGPYLIGKKGQLLDRQPGEGHPFWRAHRVWVRQGRRVEGDGETCIWDEPKPQVLRKTARKQYLVVSPGEEDGETAILPKEPTQ